MSRVKVAVSLDATATIVLGSLAAIEPSEDVELRNLDLAPWNCSMQNEGTAKSQEARERNRVKNRWLVMAYAGPPETTNCGDETFHDCHLEIFEKPGDHAPQVGDPTPIICEITPRTEHIIYR